MNKNTNYIYSFFKAILAGIMIALAGTSYLIIEIELLGTILFTIGLFVIYSLGYNLFTGKVGFLLEEKNPLEIFIIWCGNFLGTYIYALSILNTRLIKTTSLVENAIYKSQIKLNDNFISMFILAFFCGVMMYIAAKVYKLTFDTKNAVGGYIGLFLCVPTFLYLGFEHSIANMFYFTVANAWSFNAFTSIIVVSIGNVFGAVFLSAIKLIFEKNNMQKAS